MLPPPPRTRKPHEPGAPTAEHSRTRARTRLCEHRRTGPALRRHPQTIRRDINQLGDAGLLRRYHGGAAYDSSVQNTAYSQRAHQMRDEKQRIATAMAARIPDQASLFINIGTTTEAIARALLNHRDLKIITNDLHVASILSTKEDFDVLIAGGNVRSDGGVVGQATADFISQFKVDFALIGISGIDEDGTLLDFDYQEVRVSQAIIHNARKVFSPRTPASSAAAP